MKEVITFLKIDMTGYLCKMSTWTFRTHSFIFIEKEEFFE